MFDYRTWYSSIFSFSLSSILVFPKTAKTVCKSFSSYQLQPNLILEILLDISLNNKTPTHYNFHSPKYLLVHAHIPLNFYPKGKLLDYLPEKKQSYIGWYVSSYNLSLLAWLEILGWCSTKSVLTCSEKVLLGLGCPPF